jgi:hypothetical protein
VVSLAYLSLLALLVAFATWTPRPTEAPPPPPLPPPAVCPARAFKCPDGCARHGLWGCRRAAGGVAAAAASGTDPDRVRAAALMRKRGLDNFKAAVVLLRTVRPRFPDDVELKLELADALNSVMRVETNANSLVIQGTLDTPENKKIWRTLGEEAMPLAKAAHAADPTSVCCLFQANRSFPPLCVPCRVRHRYVTAIPHPHVARFAR